MHRHSQSLRLALAAGLALPATSNLALGQDWMQPAPGLWHDSANWSTGVIPDAVGASAVILADDAGGSLTSGGSFSFSSPVTLGHLTIDIALKPYSTYFNSGTLTLDNGGGADVSIFTNGAYDVQINGNIVLMGDLVADWRASNGKIFASISGDYGIIHDSGYPAPAARMRLWGVNTYMGETIARKGDISIQEMSGLGDHGVGTRVEGESTLIMENLNPITLTGEVVTLADGGAILARPCNWAETVIIDNRGRIGPWFDDYEMTVSGQITGSGVFVRRSAISRYTTDDTLEGIVTLTNPANDYTGGTEINAGILRIFDDAVLGVAGTPITFDVDGFYEGPAVFVTAADITIPRNVVMVDDGWLRAEPFMTGTYTGVVSGNRALSIGFQGYTGTVALANANSYTGATLVKAGTLLANNISGSATGTGAIVVEAGATFGGTGSVSGAVNVNGGTLAPGASAGTLSVGSLDLDAASFMDAELGGTSPGEFDAIISTGAVTLDGTLNASIINGYPLQNGDEFEIISAPSIAGSFAVENLGPNLEIEYNPNNVILRGINVVAACTPDLNGDNMVDGADLAVLLAAWGGTGPADLNSDGTVDGADLAEMLAAWGACP